MRKNSVSEGKCYDNIRRTIPQCDPGSRLPTQSRNRQGKYIYTVCTYTLLTSQLAPCKVAAPALFSAAERRALLKMVLEATFLCTDNSDYMRNGDFAPSRLEAQQDAVNLLAGCKTQQNPENAVGVLTMAGKGVEVRVALTPDVGKVLSLSHGVQLHGEINLSAGIQVAQLALKHRLNKNQRQRIIVFVGSPINEEESALVASPPPCRELHPATVEPNRSHCALCR